MVLLLPSGQFPEGQQEGWKGSLWEQGRDWGQSGGKKTRMEWAAGVIRGRRYQRESYFPFGPRTHLYSFKCSQSWQEQLAEQGPQSPLLGGVSHFQLTTPSVLLSTGAQWCGLLDAAGIKARVQKTYVFYWLSGLCSPWGVVQVQARAGNWTLFLAGRLCLSSTVPWLWEDSGVSCRVLRLGIWFSLLMGFRAWFCFAVLCMYQEVCELIQCWLGPTVTLQGFSICCWMPMGLDPGPQLSSGVLWFCHVFFKM